MAIGILLTHWSQWIRDNGGHGKEYPKTTGRFTPLELLQAKLEEFAFDNKTTVQVRIMALMWETKGVTNKRSVSINLTLNKDSTQVTS